MATPTRRTWQQAREAALRVQALIDAGTGQEEALRKIGLSGNSYRYWRSLKFGVPTMKQSVKSAAKARQVQDLIDRGMSQPEALKKVGLAKY